VEAIGEKLANARSVKGVSVEQAARDTHIARKFIEAMEQEDFDAFPGDAYLLGFLRNYASYLGLRPEELVSLYHNLRLQEQPAPIDELLDRRPRSGSVVTIAAVVVAVLLIVGIVVLFATGTISFPERDPNRAARREASESGSETNAPVPFVLADQFVERRFTEGDRVAVPVDGEDALLEFLSIGERVSVGSEAGIVQVGVGENRALDLTGDGSSNVRFEVRQIYADDEPPAAVARIDRVIDGSVPTDGDSVGRITDTDAVDLGTGMTNDPDRERTAIAVAEFPALQEYFIEADFRGLTMFRWEVDEQPREERYLQNGDRVRTSVQDIVRIWASNAGNVRLRVAGNPVELGDQGEVVAAVIRWREREQGGYALELLPMY
jgi:cytoskeleton protein RodZ